MTERAANAPGGEGASDAQIVAPTRGIPKWVWAVVGIAAGILAIVLGIFVYRSRSNSGGGGRGGGGTGLLPINPVSPTLPVSPITPVQPINPVATQQVRLPDGKYRIRWGGTQLYLGGSTQGSVTNAVLVPASSAIVWQFISSNATYIGGGRFITPSAVGLSTSTALWLPTGLIIEGQSTPGALEAWSPTHGVPVSGGTDGSIYPGVIHNIAFTGCVHPPADLAAGQPVALTYDCGPTASGWYFEPAT